MRTDPGAGRSDGAVGDGQPARGHPDVHGPGRHQWRGSQEVTNRADRARTLAELNALVRVAFAFSGFSRALHQPRPMMAQAKHPPSQHPLDPPPMKTSPVDESLPPSRDWTTPRVAADGVVEKCRQAHGFQAEQDFWTGFRHIYEEAEARVQPEQRFAFATEVDGRL